MISKLSLSKERLITRTGTADTNNQSQVTLLKPKDLQKGHQAKVKVAITIETTSSQLRTSR